MANDKDHDEHGKPIVEVTYLKTNKEIKFHAEWTETLQSVWDEAYNQLNEKKVNGDTFECSTGKDLMGYLSDTLEQLRKKEVCIDRKFQIHGPTGGA